MQRIVAGMAAEIPTLNLDAITCQCISTGEIIIAKAKEKLTYITPDWSPIDSIVVPNN